MAFNLQSFPFPQMGYRQVTNRAEPEGGGHPIATRAPRLTR